MKSVQENRRQYTREFKIEAVELLLSGNQKAVDVASNLGIRPKILSRWKGEYLDNQEHSFPGSGHLAEPDDERVRKLERELYRVTRERDILKKAMAIFSRDPQ